MFLILFCFWPKYKAVYCPAPVFRYWTDDGEPVLVYKNNFNVISYLDVGFCYDKNVYNIKVSPGTGTEISPVQKQRRRARGR